MITWTLPNWVLQPQNFPDTINSGGKGFFEPCFQETSVRSIFFVFLWYFCCEFAVTDGVVHSHLDSQEAAGGGRPLILHPHNLYYYYMEVIWFVQNYPREMSPESGLHLELWPRKQHKTIDGFWYIWVFTFPKSNFASSPVSTDFWNKIQFFYLSKYDVFSFQFGLPSKILRRGAIIILTDLFWPSLAKRFLGGTQSFATLEYISWITICRDDCQEVSENPFHFPQLDRMDIGGEISGNI